MILNFYTMKNKLKFLLTTCFMLFTKIAMSQEITINGRIDTGIVKWFGSEELILRSKQTTNQASAGEFFKAPIASDGSFKIVLSPKDSLTYFSFQMMYAKTNAIFDINVNKRSIYLSEVYLFNKGDSIDVTLYNDGFLSFKGKGSEKLNCQYLMYSSIAKPREIVARKSQIANSGEPEKALLFEDKMIDLTIQMKLNILESYRQKLTANVFKMLYLDAIASSKYVMLHDLYQMCAPPVREANRSIVQDYFEYSETKNHINVTDLNIISSSAFYADMIFEKELNYFRLFSPLGTAITSNALNAVYNKITYKYSGSLRDKLLYICFERLGNFNSAEARKLVNDAINIMEDRGFKKLLQDWRNAQFSAFPFELQDANGNIHKLENYKGKVIVIDFWFTGCTGCRTLSLAMSPIIERFKENQHVIFITVSIDQQKDVWLKSISSGFYTAPETINLYTNGLGATHPLISNYNMTSYPRQLIIDKEGLLVSSSPPRVDLTVSGYLINDKTNPVEAAKNTSTFIRILDDCLKK